MSRKRVIIEAVGVGAAASAVLTTLLMILMGSILTAAYVPDIVNSYASVDYLESKVAFGKREETSVLQFVTGLVLFIAVGGLYYRLRMRRLNRRS